MATTAHCTGLGLLRHAVAHGIPTATVTAWLGVAADELGLPGRLPVDRVVDGWSRLRAELDDPVVAARAARSWTLADWGLFGFYVATSPTAGQGVVAAARCIQLMSERGSWRVVDQGGRVRCVWIWSGPSTLDHALSNEVMVSGFARGVAELTGAPPLRVELAHRAPSAGREHARLLECDVRFGQPETAVVVSRARLEAAPPAANPRLHQFLGELVTGEIALLTSPVHERVARVLALRLRDGVVPDVVEVARNLGMSERTLRRRLQAEGVAFRELRSAAQLDRAAQLLASSEASLSEIARASGFADPSGFGRAWRRSRGQAPSRGRPARR
jgi:AraC-like DNA-binding protein